jgi:hypothetical protein
MTEHGLTDRMHDLGDRARNRATQARLEKLDRDNDRLRTEVSVLRDDLQEERSTVKEALAALKKQREPATVTISRRPRILRTIVVAGGAYVLGTRDGRERYEQIRKKARSLAGTVRTRIQQRRNPFESTTPSETSSIEGAVER